MAEDLATRLTEEDEGLIARSIPIGDCLVKVEGKIGHVRTLNHTTEVPKGKAIMGGIQEYSQAGYTTRLIIAFDPKSELIPIRRIGFDGSSGVRGGDKVKVTIDTGERKYLHFKGQEYRQNPKIMWESGFDGKDYVYIRRSLKEFEEALAIEILGVDFTLREDCSIDYPYSKGD